MSAVQAAEGVRALLAQAEDRLHGCDWAACDSVLQSLRAEEAGTDGARWAAEAAMLRVRLMLERRDFEAAARWEARAHSAASAAGDPESPLRAQLTGTSVSLALSAFDTAWQTLEQVRQALAQLAEPSARLLYEFHRARSHAHIPVDHQQEALHEGELSLRAAERLVDPRARAAALGNVAGRWYALGYRQRADGNAEAANHSLGRAVELGQEAVAAADAVGSVWLNLANLNNLCGAAVALGQDALARAAFGRLEQLSEVSGVALHRVHAAIHMARLLRREARPTEALALIDRELAAADSISALKATSVLNLVASQIHEDRGDFAQALAAYKRHHQAEGGERVERAEHWSRVTAVREAAEQARAEARGLREANAALARQALTDALTGIANRRHFDEALRDALMDRQSPDAVPGCLVLLDVDHFKQINDRCSHAVGDLVLRELAELLAQQCRHSDLAARWGGEEFALLLRGLEPEAALRVCERVRLAVQEHDWQRFHPGLAVTLSLGLTPLDAGADAAAVLRRCDLLLYRAKREGRNRVCHGDATAS